ncbi:MAG: hypothetical protein JSS88_07270 [Actinobacteria bacterium]|nr:hypothetical protein [Actinomycetota bacterium]
MPLKRTPRVERETPAARALRAAVAEELSISLTRLGEPTAKEKRKTKRWAARFSERAARDGVDAAISWAVKKLGGATAPSGRVAHYAVNVAAAKRLHGETPAEAPAGEAVRPALAPVEASADDESPEPPKPRRRRPAGFAGYAYIDPRLIDEDDWED